MSAQRYLVKICGVTSAGDARLAEEAGADFVGALVDVRASPRNLTLEQAMPVFEAPKVRRVLLAFQPPQTRLVEIVGALRPSAVQLLGNEPPSEVPRLLQAGAPLWKSVHMPPRGAPGADAERLLKDMERYAQAGVSVLVLDTKATVRGVMQYGGTGLTNDWTVAADIVRRAPLPVMLAGGIDPANVAEALERVRPTGVDLSSGVEARIGKKDPDKVRRLLLAVREAEQRIGGPPPREGEQA